jgi:hypothetical protein
LSKKMRNRQRRQVTHAQAVMTPTAAFQTFALLVEAFDRGERDFPRFAKMREAYQAWQRAWQAANPMQSFRNEFYPPNDVPSRLKGEAPNDFSYRRWRAFEEASGLPSDVVDAHAAYGALQSSWHKKSPASKAKEKERERTGVTAKGTPRKKPAERQRECRARKKAKAEARKATEPTRAKRNAEARAKREAKHKQEWQDFTASKEPEEWITTEKKVEASKLLNIPWPSSEQVIRRRQRELALQHHPDRGGDPAVMARLNKAASTLLQP